MEAGQLRHVVVLDEPVETQNATGEEIVEWSPFARAFASIEPLRGRELAAFEGIQATADTRIRLRWSPGLSQVTAKWRIRYQDTIYNIESIINVDTSFREIELICSSGINNG